MNLVQLSSRALSPSRGALVRPQLSKPRAGSGTAGRPPCALQVPSHIAVPEDSMGPSVSAQHEAEDLIAQEQQELLREAREKRRASRAREQLAYKLSAIAGSALFIGLAVFATYYRFFFHSADYNGFPMTEFWSTIAMIGGGVVAMEMYARWAHRVLWHDFKPGWAIHASHHEPRTGPFEANDIFAVANALPAIALTAYGFFTPTLAGGLCFGFGMGITVFGIMYMFVHDGLVHKRFPVGPIAEVPQLKRIAIAHRLHHSEKYGGVPFGMFLGPQELEACGAGEELDRLVEEMKLSEKRSASS